MTAVKVSKPSRADVAATLYALTGGVLWWSFHLVALAAYAPSVCDGRPRWVLSVINAVSLLGAVSALVVAWGLVRTSDQKGEGRGRARFLGEVAALFNLISLVLIVLESVPVYVLGSC